MSVLVLYLALSVATAGQTADSASQQQREPSRPTRLNPAQFSQLQARADTGDASAQALLGQAYEDGNGVPRDDSKAFQWYRKAAEQGDPEAQNKVGVFYSLGRGTDRSKEEAVTWYLKAARGKSAKAMFNLGAAYYNGDGVTTDDVESYAWFLLAHEAGYPAADDAIKRAESEKLANRSAAFAKIGQMYITGDELPKDPMEALKWDRKAADAGDVEADVKVTSLLLSSGRSPTQEEYAEARKRCEEAANRRFSPGAYCLALIYSRGLGTAKDPVESTKWFGRAADLGNARAALELGEAYWKGIGVQPDLVNAYMWVWLASSSKVPGADQDEQALRKELDAKQTQRAKQKAAEWLRTHRFMGLRQRPDRKL